MLKKISHNCVSILLLIFADRALAEISDKMEGGTILQVGLAVVVTFICGILVYWSQHTFRYPLLSLAYGTALVFFGVLAYADITVYFAADQFGKAFRAEFHEPINQLNMFIRAFFALLPLAVTSLTHRNLRLGSE